MSRVSSPRKYSAVKMETPCAACVALDTSAASTDMYLHISIAFVWSVAQKAPDGVGSKPVGRKELDGKKEGSIRSQYTCTYQVGIPAKPGHVTRKHQAMNKREACAQR